MSVCPPIISLNGSKIFAAAFLSRISIDIPAGEPSVSIYLPNLLSSSLVVYKAVPTLSSQCMRRPSTGTLLLPLLQYTSHPSETHYFPLAPNWPILLHTHASAPFIPSSYSHGLNLTIYTTGEDGCAVEHLELSVDLWATLGRWGVRYAAPAASWAVGVVGILLHDSWRSADALGNMRSVGASLAAFARSRLPMMLSASFIVSLIPLPTNMWLGNTGEWILATIAPLLLLTVTGLVTVSWLVLLALMWPLRMLFRRFSS